ncbi:uncharacterized conserved protein TIM beta/alpha-barrel fold protein [Clostridium sp. CAG:448]|nr:uncharacterized conserved protein TIM beta/alpha-barrel fold protein [Clostridium sp. CAG:448]
MACRNAYSTRNIAEEAAAALSSVTTPAVAKNADRLLFGVDSKMQAHDPLQNHLENFEWVVRNKIYPNFYGRYLTGENCLTKEEIGFLHRKGCKIAAVYADSGAKQTQGEGAILAKKIDIRAFELGIPEGTAIFLEIGENEAVSRDFMIGFARTLMIEGFTPGWKANTDAKFAFDRTFSTGMQTDKDIFQKCLIWAVAPTVKEYNGITTSHLIHPDRWMPYAPSGITRAEIAIWQYGVECHPIEDDMGRVSTFNLDLVRNEQVIVEKMF